MLPEGEDQEIHELYVLNELQNRVAVGTQQQHSEVTSIEHL